MTDIKIVCGLGNPGVQYEHTRHNFGYDIVDRLADHLAAPAPDRLYRFAYRTVKTVRFIRPLTFVNRSGEAVREAMERFGAAPQELFVICDDFYLPLGRIRIRKSGTSGGHNGLQSVIDEIGTTAFPRMRVGIGPVPDMVEGNPDSIMRFVLGKFEPDEMEIVAAVLSRAVEAAAMVLRGDVNRAINTYNDNNPTPGK